MFLPLSIVSCHGGDNLLGACVALTRVVGEDAPGIGPCAPHVLPGEAVGQGSFGEEQHTFGTGFHYMVEHGDETVDMLLLVDSPLDERVNLAIDEGVELGDKGMT